MSAPKLPPDAIDRELAAMPGWIHADDKLTRTFEFPDFVAAFGWMTRCALVAERMAHHPEWRNVYGRVTVELTTHDAGGITELDFELARAMSALA